MHTKEISKFNATFQIVNFVETTAKPGESSSGASALPIWTWIVIAVGGALLIACLVTVLSIAIYVKRKRR